MASLLYRLGRASARRAWIVIIGWIVILAAAAGAFAGFKGELASAFSIPGTETDRVTSHLAKVMPESSGASATVVFSTKSGTFTDEQRNQVGDLMKRIAAVDGVAAATDPFTSQQQLDAQKSKLADGQKQLAQGRKQLDANQAKLDAGQKQLDGAIAQAKAAGAYEQAAPQLQAQQKQLSQGKAQLEAARKTLDTQAKTLADGQKLAGYADGIRLVSSDGRTAMASVSFDKDMYSLPASVKDAVADVVNNARIDGVTINHSKNIGGELPSLFGPGEAIGLVIAAIVLIVMMRTLLPALIPVVSSLVGVGVGVLGSLAFSGAVNMASITPILGVMLGLAVGIDYSLFILNRHRRQVLAGMGIGESLGLANGTAGNAVVFAGSTVIIALLALMVTGIPFLSVMGVVGAGCVLIAVLVAITLTPALLGLLGTRVLPRKLREQIGAPEHNGIQVHPMKTVRAVGSALLAVVTLLVLASPALSMRLGLPDDSAEATNSTSYRAYKAIEKSFGAGQNGTLVVVADLPEAMNPSDQTSTQLTIATAIKSNDNVAALAPIGTSEDKKSVVFQVVPTDGPSSESTQQLVHDIRNMSPLSGNVKLGVAGQASGNIDVSAKLADALPVYLVVVIGLSFIIMLVVFRSLLVPLIASAGYVLSLFAAFGGMTAVYQWGWLSSLFGVHDPGPILSFAPLIITGILFGLAMDYQLFLVSGMREAHMHGMGARPSIVAGLHNGRAVVTAAALIMMAVFGGFMFSEMGLIRPLGFGLAFGILFDAFLVRMVIVPALMHLFRGYAWWIPKWLSRILPDVDIEGAALERSHPLARQAD